MTTPFSGVNAPNVKRAPVVVSFAPVDGFTPAILPNTPVYGLWVKQNSGPTPNINPLAQFGLDGPLFTWPTWEGGGACIDFGCEPMTAGLYLNAAVFALGDAIEILYSTSPGMKLNVNGV